MIIKRIKHIFLIFTITAIFTALAVHIPIFGSNVTTSGGKVDYILDAGHGKPDGGAVAHDNTTEAELNLLVTQKLREQLKVLDKSCVLTRQGEEGIYTSGETIHAKKVSDIKERIKIAEQYPSVPFVSVHMNSFPSQSVKGIQVFYGTKNEASKELALNIQQEINNILQPENPKSVKAIPQNIYLFSHIKNPTVLIECGFISNPSELDLLKSEEYQSKIAKTIADALSNS